MNKKRFLKFVCDPYIIVSILVGVILMYLTLHFGVNPACCAAADEAVLGMPWVYWPLFVTTMPALLIGVTIADLLPGTWIHHDWAEWFVVFPMIYLVQIVLFAALGLILRWIHKAVFYTRKSPPADSGTI